MDATQMGSRTTRAVAIAVLIGCAALGTAGCQSTVEQTEQVRVEEKRPAMDPEISKRFSGMTADRAEVVLKAEALERAKDFAACGRHVVVTHADGGDHLACVPVWAE